MSGSMRGMWKRKPWQGYSGTARRKGRQQTNQPYRHRATSLLYLTDLGKAAKPRKIQCLRPLDSVINTTGIHNLGHRCVIRALKPRVAFDAIGHATYRRTGLSPQ